LPGRTIRFISQAEAAHRAASALIKKAFVIPNRRALAQKAGEGPREGKTNFEK
jgi:hypothetical protein